MLYPWLAMGYRDNGVSPFGWNGRSIAPMGVIRWIFAVAVLACWSALIGTALYVALYQPHESVPQGDAIVVLSGSDRPDGSGTPETRARMERAISLFEAGSAPRIVVTGGGEPGQTSAAEVMANIAIEAGIPADAITLETAARSTLQNALFVADLEDMTPQTRILLVSHRYHLPRAKASFRWAGFSNVTSVAADPDAGFRIDAPLVYEGGKWPLNTIRAAMASAAMAGDVPRESYIRYLE